LNDTVQFLSESQRERYVPGRAGLLNQEVPAWDFGMLEGAGALYSTVSDLGRFLEMNRNPAASPFPEAIELTHVARRSLSPTAEICLGWHRARIGGHDCWWHNGATLGHSSLVAFSVDPPLSLVVLANAGPAVFSGAALADQVGSPLLQHFLKGEPAVSEAEDSQGR
jgi:CubicO group peptidase (beta-lactamase class C family)